MSAPGSSGRSAIILAGGESTRMGRDKALLPFKGRPLVQNIFETIEPYFDEIILSSNHPERYGFLKARVVLDEETGRGPLMGLYSALRASSSEINFVVACDIPEVNVRFMLSLLEHAAEYDAVVASIGEWREPLFSVYRKSLTSVIRAVLDEGKNKITCVFGRCRVKYLQMEEAAWYRNINTDEDYESLSR
ncbi:MAG: molybdenum cofactor guanylyltransferase [Acidobacteriota bacterium]